MADIISSIPDEILLYILSFLPTKQVVATTILCKRWNLLWRSVPSFDFVYSDDYHWHKEEESYNHFLHSVYSFMHLRDLDQPLRRFSLNCDARLYDPASTDKWVRAAISGRVEHLHFKLLWNVLPSVVFSCKTLVVLKLEFLKVEDIHFFELPLLKILHLYHVYSSEGIHLSQLFAGSPNLEDLEAENTYICHESKFNRLPKLVRANIQAEFVPMEIVKNVEVLFIDWVMPVGFFSYYFPFLRKKKGISNVWVLILCVLQIFQGDLDSCFHNLVQLELKTLQHTEEWPLEVLEILKHCPKLQTLALYIYNKV